MKYIKLFEEMTNGLPFKLVILANSCGFPLDPQSGFKNNGLEPILKAFLFGSPTVNKDINYDELDSKQEDNLFYFFEALADYKFLKNRGPNQKPELSVDFLVAAVFDWEEQNHGVDYRERFGERGLKELEKFYNVQY